jgi:hypothetical protein
MNCALRRPASRDGLRMSPMVREGVRLSSRASLVSVHWQRGEAVDERLHDGHEQVTKRMHDADPDPTRSGVPSACFASPLRVASGPPAGFRIRLAARAGRHAVMSSAMSSRRGQEAWQHAEFVPRSPRPDARDASSAGLAHTSTDSTIYHAHGDPASISDCYPIWSL